MSLFLSQLMLDVRSRVVQQWLSDVDKLHRDVLMLFERASVDGSARLSLGVLFRLDRQRDGELSLIIQSNQPPSFSRLPAHVLASEPVSKSIDEHMASLLVGQVLRFRLRANPTRKVDTKTGEDGKRRNGRRVALTSPVDRMDWLKRKAQQHGFELGSVNQSGEVRDVIDISEGSVRGHRQHADEGHQETTFGSCVFEGTLRVTNAEEFKQAIVGGVGSGKAFGFGLLSVAPSG